jgi:hypothetical protein
MNTDDKAQQRGRSASALSDAGGELLRQHGLAVVIGWALALLGGLLAIIGYISVSGTADVSKQISHLAGTSIAGLALVGIGGALVLTSHYRRTIDALLDLRDDLLDEPDHPTEDGALT